jgi:hypothetical protein
VIASEPILLRERPRGRGDGYLMFQRPPMVNTVP